MKTNDLKQAVLSLLEAHREQPLAPADMAEALKLRAAEKKRLGGILHALTVEGRIARIRGNRYALGAEADLVTGRLEVSRAGDGFINGTSGQCLAFVPRTAVGTALHGDQVVVRIEAEVDPARQPPEGGRAGRVIRVLERSQRELVGTLRTTGRFLCVVPIDPRFRQDFYVPDAGGAKVGDRVIIRFAAWESDHVNPEGEIVEVIGPSDEPSLDTTAIMRHYGLAETFPAAVIDEAETAGRRLARPGRRLDLREKLILTIDPERARDFDDALSLERDAAGRRVLGVHIADVAHFVRPGSALDAEAQRRGNSVYLPDQVIPMLPEQLSNGACSLRPDVDRLTFSAFLTVDDAGNVVGAHFARSRIRSRLRLTYEQVLPILRGRTDDPAGDEAAALLRGLHELAQQMRRLRMSNHALDLDMPESEVVIGPGGITTDIRQVENDESHQLVEECMVAANEAVARELANRSQPALYRVHAPPSPEKMWDLGVELSSLGYQPGDLKNRRNLADFLRRIKDDPRAAYVRLAVLKSLNRAEYTPRREEHFGLAKTFYTHFTSPIRRYPDLVVHRQLALLTGDEGEAGAKRRSQYDAETLLSLARHCSDTERTADDAERALTEIKVFRFLKAQLDEGQPRVYDAIVVNVTNFGLFVEVPKLQVQGLIHVSSLSERFVRYDRDGRCLRDGNTCYAVEARLQVQVAGVDMENRRLDFTLAREDGAAPAAPAAAPAPRGSRGPRGRRGGTPARQPARPRQEGGRGRGRRRRR